MNECATCNVQRVRAILSANSNNNNQFVIYQKKHFGYANNNIAQKSPCNFSRDFHKFTRVVHYFTLLSFNINRFIGRTTLQ